jgi:acetyltransferase-like isoleucine patch superfamily enzyme
MGYGSSIAQNCSIASEHSGVVIGKNVMMAPNAVIVDFNHGFSSTKIPMVIQSNESKKVIIEDDVWIASNCTIGKGVKIGRGSIISANSLVNKDVDPFSIFGGVPAKLIKHRS